MCGRFTLTVNPAELQAAFSFINIPDGAESVGPRYNIAPSQPIAVLPNDGLNTLDYFTWGLIPSWSKDPSIGNKMINARGETVAEKPSFRSAYKRRRCLIFTDGFYEWVKPPGESKKVPHYIQLTSEQPFAFAGLWEQWYSPDGSEIKSTTIITTDPNPKIAKLHNRMPVILPDEAIPIWLEQGEQPREKLDPLLAAYPAELMKATPVSTYVNSPFNEGPQCVAEL